MKNPAKKKKLTPEKRARLIARAMADAEGKEVFPESMAEARKFVERLKTGIFAPGVKW